MEKKTLAAVDSEYFALIMSAHEAAFDKIASPEYVPVLPPPDDKSPGSLIQAWGLEMFRVGFETGFDLADKLSNMEGKEHDEG